ncbi:MAG: class I SAM-dependent methyltransferase [Methanosarcinales archaeon]|nr:class I SAM-dependent methyltransferase [Methanosarcinales archaeon]
MFPEEPNDWPLDSVHFWLKQYEEHVARYRFFSEYATNKDVLDAGCGFGYGSVILSNHKAKKVVGIDNSYQTLKYVVEKYNFNNISHVVSDVTCTPFASRTFGAIYAFEVIEHIKNDNSFLLEMIRILKDDGYIFISTPNKKFHSKHKDFQDINPFHIREYELNEFRNILEKKFSHVEIYGERYSKKYIIDESNLNVIKVIRDKVIHLEQKVDYLEQKINFLNNRLHIELIKKIIPRKLHDPLYLLLEKYKPNYGKLDYLNEVDCRFGTPEKVGALISIAPASNEIVIDSENLDDALYFIGVCKK